ncbi:ATP-binding cassette domain-containing protein [Micromonospora costi]|uniref:Sugar ABC transporter ATP-binding protein n=1 Tax=Micromonospora costi TaxID=1530042 RepID=A0A3A9ZY37_9ACTN|nr:ATP-binding cassette domain-containing protein [Micromonospora costi]RKN52974.1 sugar ABC transporter ATP-binding protein [Micromonospora costi]
MNAPNTNTTGHDERTPVLAARGLVKRYGHVTALNGSDFDLWPGEVLAVVGDNGAGKSTLIKALAGAIVPDSGHLLMDGEQVSFKSPLDARRHGIETVFQDLAVAPALDITTNIFLGRESRSRGFLGAVLRRLDKKAMRTEAAAALTNLGITTARSVTQPVETLSGGQRQAVAVARAAAWSKRVVILDEPTAALGVRESGQVLELIRRVREQGLAVVLISHNMPQIFEVADRIHIHRLGRRVAVVRPQESTMAEVVSIMTGALPGNDSSVAEAPSAQQVARP